MRQLFSLFVTDAVKAVISEDISNSVVGFFESEDFFGFFVSSTQFCVGLFASFALSLIQAVLITIISTVSSDVVYGL